MRRALFFSVVVVLSTFLITPLRDSSDAKAALPGALTAAKTGWWIKVRTDRTESTSIDLQIGTKREDRETWRTWRSSDPTEFDVPDKYLQVARIYLNATVNPQGKMAWFCLMYKDHGVKHFDFDNHQEEDKNQTDGDSDCD